MYVVLFYLKHFINTYNNFQAVIEQGATVAFTSNMYYNYTGAKATKYADFGEGKGVIFLDSVKCKGTEKYLNECSSDPLTVHNCGHNKDAGVICEGILIYTDTYLCT